MVYYRNLWNIWNGNTCHLYVNMAEVIMHGRPDVTSVNSTLRVLLNSFLPHENVCGIHTSATIQLVLIIRVACESSWSTRVQHYTYFVTKVIFRAKVWVSATIAWVDLQDESKSFKIICPCRCVRTSISQYIGHSLGNNYPLANLPSMGLLPDM